MLTQRDFLMRQIESMVQCAARLLFGKSVSVYAWANEETRTDADMVLLRLTDDFTPANAHQLREKLQQIDGSDGESLRMALCLYNRLNCLSDEMLEQANYPREELQKDLSALLEQAGLPSLLL